MTVDDVLEPITWIGSRHVDCRRHAHPEKVLPVRVKAGAFAASKPDRDIWLSPDHAVYAEGVLIPIKYLINGSTVRQTDAEAITYYHLALPRHAAILAEGLPVESYLDTGDSISFSNEKGPIALHPTFGSERCETTLIADALGYAPLTVSGAEVDCVKALLQSRATMPAVEPLSVAVNAR